MLFAIFLEVLGTTCLKLSDGMTKWTPTLLLLPFYGGSFFALARALKVLDVGVAYAVWAGLGTALIAAIGFIYFGEHATAAKIFCLALIIGGIIGLNLTGAAH